MSTSPIHAAERLTCFPLCLAIVAATASLALAQTPGTQTGNPFTTGITPGVTVRVGDFATIPNSDGSAPRMNDASVAPDGRLFIVDQRGPIYSAGTGGTSVTPTQYVNLSSLGLGLLSDNGERGVASIAFHPQFDLAGTPGYGKFYVSFSSSNTAPTPDYAVAGQGRTHDEVIYEFTAADPLAATYTPAATPRQVLRIAEPSTNHNGGGLKFNPTAQPGDADYGQLYYGLGDGGGGGDPLHQGQNNNALLGKILRIDPLGTDGPSGNYGIAANNAFASDGDPNTRAEIFATGFRNPQKFSWDVGGSHEMFAGDIGQGVVEEIDKVVNGNNYGWGIREGSFVYINGNTVAFPNDPDLASLTRPVAEYDHSEGISITGGFVYRGSSIPELEGKYVFGDLATGRIFYIDADSSANPTVNQYNTTLRELFLSTDGVNSLTLQQIINSTVGSTLTRSDLRFGQDEYGNLYLLNKHDGEVRILLPSVVPEPTTLALAGLTMLTLRRRRA